MNWITQTLVAEEASGNVQLLGANNNDLLSCERKSAKKPTQKMRRSLTAQKLLGDSGGQATQKMPSCIDNDLLLEHVRSCERNELESLPRVAHTIRSRSHIPTPTG